MAKKDQSDREIADFLAKLRAQTESPAPEKTETVSKKTKDMTDDEIKAMLRRHYKDIDTLPQEKEPAFEFDTSDFVPDEPLEFDQNVEKPKKARAERKKAHPKPEPEVIETVVEPEVEVVDEPEAIETVVEPEVEVVDEPEAIETVVEPEVEVVAEPEPIVTDEIIDDELGEAETDGPEYTDDTVTDAFDDLEDGALIIEESHDGSDDEDAADEILYDVTDLASDDTEQRFALGEEDVDESVTVEVTPELTVEEAIEEETVKETVEETVEEASEEAVQGTDGEYDDIELVDQPVLSDDEPELVDQPVLPEDEDSREWRPFRDVSGRSDDGELDLMVALGFGDKVVDKYGDERVRRAEEKLRIREEREALEVNAKGYVGAELTPHSDPERVKARYADHKRFLLIELIATAVLTALLFFFENMPFWGIDIAEILSLTSFRTIFSTFLLAAIAAISYQRLFEATLFAIGRRRRGNVVLPITLLVVLGYDLTVIFSFTQSVAPLFNFPVALGFVFELLAELFDLVREKRVFGLLYDAEAGHLCGLTSLGNDGRDRDSLSADAIPFVEGFFRRSSDNRRSYQMQLLLTVLPLAACGALLAIASSVVDIEPIRAVSCFPAVFAFATPLASLFNRAWQLLRATLSLSDKHSAVIGGVATSEYLDAGSVVFDDELAFPSDGVEIKNIKLYDNCDIYNTIYNVNALFREAGGPLRRMMEYTAANLGQAKSAVMTAAGDHYVEALIDGENTVCAGSYAALTSRGIAIEKNRNDSRDSEDSCVMYAAINGVACARFCVRYTVSEKFLRTAELLAAEGIGIRLRTLDPNLDRAMLVAVFGESVDAGVRREPSRSYPEEQAGTSIVARGDRLALAEPLVVSRRLCRAERKLAVAGILQLMVGVVAATLVTFFAVPGHMISALASIVQLLGVVPAAVIYSLNVKLYKDKK